MIIDYRLIGISSSGVVGTMELLDTDKTTFWADFDMPKDRTDALFRWAKEEEDFWKQAWIAEVECEGVARDGSPLSAKIKGIRMWDLSYKPYPQWHFDHKGVKYHDWKYRKP